ncbi:hypothetical protein F8O01_00525 [Pseudoclavibacter chungangensis]|uniref:Uncharacterized protein n=1 Tax=Pseudoclavibacter chungangensis TaxID=587635 RepID=A0A7J5C3W6_9MICO|nr:hypothetical protein [Pseudoclavibacter chungangensis]KAB1662469.1 hypothetical protein F8O01_00525 [Pseudoclavibacter chungangensis]NYJ68502.1 hypothetical protein [Pseudoclavibacter chungangensis]
MIAVLIGIGVVYLAMLGWACWVLVRRDLDGIRLVGRVAEVVALVLVGGLLGLWGLVPAWLAWLVVVLAALAVAIGVLRRLGVLPPSGRPAVRERPDGRARPVWPSIVSTVVGVFIALAVGALTVVAGA